MVDIETSFLSGQQYVSPKVSKTKSSKLPLANADKTEASSSSGKKTIYFVCVLKSDAVE